MLATYIGKRKSYKTFACSPGMTLQTIIKIEANNPTPLFRTVKYLRERLEKEKEESKVSLNKDKYEITIENRTKEHIEILMNQYIKSLSTGHGTYDFKYTIESKEISERQKLEEEIKKEYSKKIDELNQEKTRLEKKWNKDRTNYESKISSLEAGLKDEKEKRQQQEKQYAQNILGKSAEIDGLNATLTRTKKELDKRISMPFYKVLWEQALRFVNKGK